LFVLEPFGGLGIGVLGSQALTNIWICSRTALREVVLRDEKSGPLVMPIANSNRLITLVIIREHYSADSGL
jgi:hypothetical protein